jgi:excisionase family DNA binding protein
MNRETLESFVDADEAAKFLSITRRRVLELARARRLPGHPIGDGSRRVWRFRLSELAAAVVSTQKIGLASRERAGMVRPQTISGAIG